jgi:putative membrane protein
MPLFEWLKNYLDLSRNHFDRVGHFAQGFTPALVVRELLTRQTHLQTTWVRNVLSVSVALSFSAAYEILEWLWVIIFTLIRVLNGSACKGIYGMRGLIC